MDRCPLSIHSINHQVISRKGCSQRSLTLTLLKLLADNYIYFVNRPEATIPQWSLPENETPLINPNTKRQLSFPRESTERTERKARDGIPSSRSQEATVHPTGQCPDKETGAIVTQGARGLPAGVWTFLGGWELQGRCHWILSPAQNLYLNSSHNQTAWNCTNEILI